jgi:uncharacterized membrane protein YedE/YeeE
MDAFIAPLIGGLLIGISSLGMLALLGRITGISGIFCGAITLQPEGLYRWGFLLGLLVGPLLYHGLSNTGAPAPSEAGALLTIVAGLLVGFGTRYGGGCTSGHGVCGIGRLSPRSIAATCTFMAAGFVTVFIARHLLG